LIGNTTAENGRDNLLKLYKVLDDHIRQHPEDEARFPNFGRSKPLLAIGATKPLEEGPTFTAAYFHGADGLGNISQRRPDIVPHEVSESRPHPYLRLTDEPGVDIVLRLLKEREARTVTYIALAPLTTLALALQRDESIIDRIGRVVCMGSAEKVFDNCIDAL
jgi:inosine-uridine nucleoside N-ribohydrolase